DDGGGGFGPRLRVGQIHQNDRKHALGVGDGFGDVEIGLAEISASCLAGGAGDSVSGEQVFQRHCFEAGLVAVGGFVIGIAILLNDVRRRGVNVVVEDEIDARINFA